MPAAETPGAVFGSQSPAPVDLSAFESPAPMPGTAPGPRTIHINVHGGPVEIHAPGADPAEITAEVGRYYELMLRRAVAEAGLAEDDA